MSYLCDSNSSTRCLKKVTIYKPILEVSYRHASVWKPKRLAVLSFMGVLYTMKKSYSDQLKDPRWQKKRLEIMQRDNFACQLCGDKDTMLNVHHKAYTAKQVWNEPKKNLVTICNHCHFCIHDDKSPFQKENRFFIDNCHIFKRQIYSFDNNQKAYLVIISEQSKMEILNLYDFNNGITIKRNCIIYNDCFAILMAALSNSSTHLL